jgi:hypothetical protein
VLLDGQEARRVNLPELIGGVTIVLAGVGEYDVLDLEIAGLEDLVSAAGELLTVPHPLDLGLGGTEDPAGKFDGLAVDGGLVHRRLEDLWLQGQYVHVDVLVNVAEGVGGVAAVIAGVVLQQLLEDNGGGRDLPPGVVGRLGDGPTVVDPLYLGLGHAARLALELDRLVLGRVHDLRLDGEVRHREHLQVYRVGLGRAHAVGHVARVRALVLEVHVLYHEGLAVIAFGNPVVRPDPLPVFTPDGQRQGRPTEYAEQLDLLATQCHLVLSAHVLLDGLAFVRAGGRARRYDVEEDPVAHLVLVPEERSGRAGVVKVLGGVALRDVAEPEVALGVEGHSRVVDGLDAAPGVLYEPVDVGLGPAVGWLARKLEWVALLDAQRHRRLVLEGIQLGFAHEHGVRGRDAPLVSGEALILPEVLVPGLGYYQGTSPRLLGYAVVVRLPFEVLAVLYPLVPAAIQKLTFVSFQALFLAFIFMHKIRNSWTVCFPIQSTYVTS